MRTSCSSQKEMLLNIFVGIHQKEKFKFVDDKFNEESLEEIHVYTEPHYLELKDGEEIQFVRFGYCRK